MWMGRCGTQGCVAVLLLAALAMGQTSYLDNGYIRIGVDLAHGGAISYLSQSGSSESVVNVFDLGRYIQQSYYGGPKPFIPPGAVQKPFYAGWGWNPVQAGDAYGYPSQLLAYSNDGTTLYIKCRPQQWALLNVPSECTMESWITLEQRRVNVRHRLINTRSDTTQYGAFNQELPAIYTVGTLCNLYTYLGYQPFTGDAVTRIENSGPPWVTRTAMENWVAQVNSANWGLGIFRPGGIYNFGGGFYGTPDIGGPGDPSTGYIAPNWVEILDYNVLYEYEYVLILDTLDNIRSYAYAHRPDPRPNYIFREDRQHFKYVRTGDTGWPIPGCLRLNLSNSDPQIIGPSGPWNASDVPQLYIRAAFRTQDNHAELFFAPFPGDFSSDRRYVITTIPDGVVRTYSIDLLSNPLYSGPIKQIRFDPVQSSSAGDSADIYSITTEPPTPTDFYITQQPLSQGVCPGSTGMFTVVAVGTGTLSYQWQKNGSNITDGGHYSGCTTSTLTVSNCDSSDASTDYRCVVSSANGSENSKQATLSLTPTVVITSQPGAQNVCPGATATFTVAATGVGTLNYQWQKDGSNLTNGGHYSGATADTLMISTCDPSDAAGYRCVVDNDGCGSRTSNEAALTVKAATSINGQAQSQTVSAGATVSFSVTATGYGTLTYQWLKGGVNLTNGGRVSGATSPTLQMVNVTTGDAGNYACSARGGCGNEMSDAASLTVIPWSQPADFDHDSDVDQEDFGLLQQCLRVTDPKNDPTCAQVDLTGDNIINGLDVTLFRGCMSGARIPGSPNCPP